MMVSRTSSQLSVTQNTQTFTAGVGKKMLKKTDQALILWEELYPNIPIPFLLHCLFYQNKNTISRVIFTCLLYSMKMKSGIFGGGWKDAGRESLYYD